MSSNIYKKKRKEKNIINTLTDIAEALEQL